MMSVRCHGGWETQKITHSGPALGFTASSGGQARGRYRRANKQGGDNKTGRRLEEGGAWG